MSWGIQVTGTKEAVKAKVIEQLDKCAANYSGGPEARDIAAARDRILDLVDACKLVGDSYVDWNGVVVEASGSHSTTDGGIASASFQVKVTRTSLAL